MIQESELIQLISQHPERGDLPVALVRAFCLVESSNNPWAFRYEPTYKWLVGTPEMLTATERAGQMISWGLMQVMGGVARELGFKNDFPLLTDPALGLSYGMQHLRHYLARHRTWPETIAAYNAGSPRRIGTVFVNQSYVDKIYKAWNLYDVNLALHV